MSTHQRPGTFLECLVLNCSLYQIHHRSRSSSGTLDREDDAEAFVPKLLDSKLSQPSALPALREARRGVGDKMPSSTSASWAAGDLLPDPEASGSASSSSSLSSWYASYLGLDGEPRARERTTSPLQMGHVRRRVVNQGVLNITRLARYS